MRGKSWRYYRWHTKPWSSALHWFIVLTATTLAILLVLGSFIPATYAATLTIQPDGSTGQDSWIESSNSTNNGNQTTAEINLASSSVTFAFFKFPLNSIPSGSTIESATLTLRVTSSDSTAGYGLNGRRVTQSWDESSITGNSHPTVDTGTDYTDVQSPNGASTVTFAVTDLVRGWHNGSLNNYGIRIAFEGQNDMQPGGAPMPLAGLDYYYFATSEHGTSSYRPYLTVNYTGGSSSSPTPSSGSTPTSTPTAGTNSGSTNNTSNSSNSTPTPTTGSNATSGSNTSKSTPTPTGATTSNGSATPTPDPQATTTPDSPDGAEEQTPPVSTQFAQLGFTHGTRGKAQTPKPKVNILTDGQPVAPVTKSALLTTGLAVATVGMPLATASASLLQLLLQLPAFLTSHVLNAALAIGLRKPRYPWGRVIDSVTQAPIKRARVTLHSSDRYGKIIDQAITDKDGRFGFLTEPGHYTLWAKHPAYSFPSQIAPKAYRGATFPIGNERMVVLDLLVDPIEYKRTWVNKLRRTAIKLEVLRLPILILGTTLAGVGVATNPIPLTYAIIGLYVILWGIEIHGRRLSRNTILLRTTAGSPAGFAIARLKNKKTGELTVTKASDANGEIYLLVPAGDYHLSITHPQTGQSLEKDLELPRGIPLKQMKLKLSK